MQLTIKGVQGFRGYNSMIVYSAGAVEYQVECVREGNLTSCPWVIGCKIKLDSLVLRIKVLQDLLPVALLNLLCFYGLIWLGL